MTDTPEQKEETPKLITREEYIQDIKTRVNLFKKEFNAFVEDVKKLVDFLKPYVVKTVDTVKELFTKVKARFKKGQRLVGNKLVISVIDKRMATQQPSDYIYGQKGPSHYDSVDRELWRNQPAFEALRAAGGYRYPKQDFGPGGNNQWGTGWGSPSGTGTGGGGGGNTGGGNTGGGNTGGGNTGGGNTGGGNTGGDNTGGDNTGGDNTGGDNTGGDTSTSGTQKTSFISATVDDFVKTAEDHPTYQSPYYDSAADKATQQANTLFTGNQITNAAGDKVDEMISGNTFTGGGGAVTNESLGKTNQDDRNFVQKSYWDIFGRAPDKEGYDYWTNELNTGAQTADSFIASLQGSSEAKLRDETGQGGTGLLYEKVDDYLAGGGQGGDPSVAAGSGQSAPDTWDTTEYFKPTVVATTNNTNNTGGGTTVTQTGGNNTGGVTTTESNASQSADDWLQSFYTEAGLGQVDAGGRDYWMKDLNEKGQTKEQIKANIMLHKK